ncbi:MULTISPECIES: hypothetical protein [Nostocales]|uniref:Uncharacterized protein n=3 Tax=Nostocales TaxID=1161 RepID=A0A0C1R6J0_9CYAN|nr:hypothetical protein [Tolypothrix bouteillei]KAF3887787.1 hypothetical protein DA73_0400021535 [Tolypothrix bouteillei VB521301]
MIYGKMPMMIFILASGYLLAVYLLLALAKRTGNKTVNVDSSRVSQTTKEDVTLRSNVTEATSLH